MSPFTGDSPVAVAYRHVREEPMPPTQRNPDVPADLEQIILTAMAKDPDHRYQTADDLRADLLRFRRGRPLAAAPVTALVAEVPTLGAAAAGAAVGAGAVAAAATMQNPTVPPADVDGGPPADQPPHGRRRALIIALIVLGIIVLVGLGIGIWALSGDDTPQVSVADVVNQPFATAKTQLEDDGFKVNEERVTNADVPVDIVISQDPKANAKADKGSEVTLTVSAGADTVPVVNVDDKSFADAQRILTAQGFEVQRQDEASSTVDKDRVIRTNPAGGDPAPKNSIVQVFVSTGVRTDHRPRRRGSGLGGRVHDARRRRLRRARGHRVEQQRQLGQGHADRSAGRHEGRPRRDRAHVRVERSAAGRGTGSARPDAGGRASDAERRRPDVERDHRGRRRERRQGHRPVAGRQANASHPAATSCSPSRSASSSSTTTTTAASGP